MDRVIRDHAMTNAASRHALLVVTLLLLGTLPIPAGVEASPTGDPSQVRSLVLEAVELEGNTRTRVETVLDRLELHPGDSLDPTELHEAVRTLRRARLFREVDVYTRAGSEPGRIVVVFRVKENRPHIRLGAGYENLSGWYLIPLELNLDNLTGRGEAFNVRTRFGYRVAGLILTYRSSPEFLRRPYWEVRLRGEGHDRVYFLDETEVNQHVGRSGLDLAFGLPLHEKLGLRAWVSPETVEPDSGATVYSDREILGRERGDEIPFTDLPPEIQRDLGKRSQTRIGLSLNGSSMKGQGLRAQGLRGRLGVEGILSSDRDFLSLDADVRGYAPLTRGFLLAGRIHGASVTDEAPFYERHYLGGLYTVRGFPSQSLSAPEGNLHLMTASVELRRSWVGPPEEPRVTAILFGDVGWSWSEGSPDLEDAAASIGYGVRLRLPWVRQVGLDVGVPLTSSPLRESFHINLSLGWTY